MSYDSMLFLFFKHINDAWLAMPSAFLFLLVGIVLTIKTRFLQLRGFSRFIQLVRYGSQQIESPSENKDSMSPLQALFTALATSIGIGNIVGPATAILLGGPGALLWLLCYIFFASITKYTEVCFALHTRVRLSDGTIVGGPIEYLRMVHPLLASWYGWIMAVLFIGWSGQQANTLATIYALESIPPLFVGFGLAVFVFVIVQGGAHRVGLVASRLVPVMFVLYVIFAFYIIFKDSAALLNAVRLLPQGFLCSSAPLGGFLGASVCDALRYGVFRGIYISESGLGTASIPHAMSDAKHHQDQGILAMGGSVADMILSLISGLLILVTGVWATGTFSTTIMYEAFKIHTPVMGQYVLLLSISLFVLTTVMGNSFNGIKSFTGLVGPQGRTWYIAATVLYIVVGALLPTRLIWEMMDTALSCATIPNLVGIVYLAYRYPHVIAWNGSKKM